MRIAKRILSLALMGAIVMSSVGCEKDKNEGTEGQNENADKNKNVTLVSQDADFIYEEKLFDTSYVHTINIEIAEADWEDLKANPLNKTKYEADVTIDGETVQKVSFATKGNTSLSSVASDSESDRYSFKINFGKFEDDQTYYGLDKLNLNNIYADATYMKDYLSYEIFRAAGVEAPLTSYVFVYINGEEFGLYIAIEEIGDSYLQRTNDSEGELYKPETEQLDNMIDGGDKGEMPEMNGEVPEMNDEVPQMPEMNGENGGQMPEAGEIQQMPDMGEVPQMPESGEIQELPGMSDMSDMDNMKDIFENNGGQMNGDGQMDNIGNVGGGMNDFGNSDSGAALTYTDDSIESYSDIFDNAETDATEEDMQRVVEALKGLSEGEELESYLDTDGIIRYFVAHNFVMNYDSYTGNMLHNYYLYENAGRLSLLPWDYNLAFGAFSMSGQGEDAGATSLINCGIDTPLSGATEDTRPMWAWITSNDEYLEKYHTYFNDLITNYFESGEFEKEIDRVYEMILPYVEKDVSAFYSVDEFKTGYETLKEFCKLRAESIRKQLDGQLATDTTKQDAEAKVDASAINIQDMGSQNMDKDNMGMDNMFNDKMNGYNNMDVMPDGGNGFDNKANESVLN